MYPKLALEAHPFANPHRGQFGRNGQFNGVFTRSFRDANGRKTELRVVGRADASRWLPHQGKQEIARRQRQIERMMSKFADRATAHVAHAFGYSEEFARREVDRGIAIITEQRIGADLMTSDKPFKSEVLDSGNPVGKRVVWSSSGVEKVGTIKHVVPAGKLPSDFGVKIKDATTPRDHESFIVEAVTTGADVPAKVGTYWPRASVLKFS